MSERERIRETMRTGRIVKVEAMPNPERMTHQEETRIINALRAQRSRVYRYEPVFFDRLNPPANKPDLAPGSLVVKVRMHGAPKNGTMGMTYIGDPETGEFYGMVMQSSLVPAKR